MSGAITMSQLVSYTESGEQDDQRPSGALSTVRRSRGGLTRVAGGVMRSRALHVALALTPAVIAVVQTIVTRRRR